MIFATIFCRNGTAHDYRVVTKSVANKNACAKVRPWQSWFITRPAATGRSSGSTSNTLWCIGGSTFRTCQAITASLGWCQEFWSRWLPPCKAAAEKVKALPLWIPHPCARAKTSAFSGTEPLLGKLGAASHPQVGFMDSSSILRSMTVATSCPSAWHEEMSMTGHLSRNSPKNWLGSCLAAGAMFHKNWPRFWQHKI